MLHLAQILGVVLAQEDSETGSGFPLLLVLLAGVAVFMFLSPRRRQMKAMRREQEELRESLGFGDDIITIGGIHGRVVSTTEHDVTIDVGGGVEMRIARFAVRERVGDDEE